MDSAREELMANYYHNPLVDHDALAQYGGFAFVEAYLGGFGDAPPNFQAAKAQVVADAQTQLTALRDKYGLTAAKQQAEALVKQKAAEILKSSGAAAAEKYVREQGKAYIAQASETLGIDAAKNYAKDFLKGMKIPNIPNIPIQLPSKLTVGEIEKAAYNTGKAYAENLIQSNIGIHIDLPKKFTLKEISKSVDSLIPDNAREALDMSLSIGSQLAAGAASTALTGVLAATAIGSAIPGLGTIVGLGVGLATIALKGLIVKTFTKSACEMDRSRCKCKTPTPAGWNESRPYKFSCPSPGKRSPVEILPWIADEYFRVNQIVLKPAGCDVGEIPECKRYLRTLATLVVPYVGTTIPVMGLPALEKLLPSYEKAATMAEQGPGYTHQGDAGGLIKYGWSAGTNGLGFTTPAVPPPLDTMRARIAKLRDLVVRINNIPKTTSFSSLRWDLLTEMSNAVSQYSLNPSAENEKWFVQLGTAVVQLEQAEKNQQQAVAKQQEAGRQLAKSREDSKEGPLWKLYTELDNTALYCDDPKKCPARDKILAQILDWHRKGLKMPANAPKDWLYYENMFEAQVQKERAASGKTTAPAAAKPTKTQTPPAAKPPVKRSNQKIDNLKKEIADLKKKAASAHSARLKAERSVRAADAQRQETVLRGLSAFDRSRVLQPTKTQTVTAVNEATAAAAEFANQLAKVRRAAASAGVPMSAVHQVLSKPPLPAPQRLLPPVLQQTFGVGPFTSQRGAEPARPAVPTDRPELFLPFLRR